jgi:hypothetical protein
MPIPANLGPHRIKIAMLWLYINEEDVWSQAGTTFPLSYNFAKLLAHLIYFMNMRCHVPKPQMSNIHPANLIRLGYSFQSINTSVPIGADMLYPPIPKICNALPIRQDIAY